ncbi:MAG: hypothetical protein EBS68_15325 [Rhodobacteraceae bacterium]|nr:hypothetical protein [Paracoccaceae bacterium]
MSNKTRPVSFAELCEADDSDKKIIGAINPLALSLGLKPDELSTASISANDIIEALGYAIKQLKEERDQAFAQLAQREAEIEQLHHINDACIELENQLRAAFEAAARANRQRDDALKQRDEHFLALSSVTETLALLIPALETASGLKAAEFYDTCPDNGTSRNEWAALWLARSIQEGAQLNPPQA